MMGGLSPWEQAMINPQFLDALRKICMRLKDCQSGWVVTGSMGMALQGMDLEVNDIDLQTDGRGAYEIEGLLSEYTLEPVRFLASAKIRSHLGALKIDGVRVEIMGDIQKLLDTEAWEDPVRVEDHREWVKFDEWQVPVLSLEYEYQAYLKMGRVERAGEIRKWLDENHKEA
jgi:hypothetical protein